MLKSRRIVNIFLTFVLFLFVTDLSLFAAEDASQLYGQSAKSFSRDKNDSGRVLSVEFETVTTIEIPSTQLNSCQARLTQDYQQRNTLARVTTIIENESCIVGSGTYDVIVSVQGDDGVNERFEFSEVWEQTDTVKQSITRDYPIGENVRLRRVRTGRVRCECSRLKTD